MRLREKAIRRYVLTFNESVFLNRDPIGEAGGLNTYGFLGNDPLNQVDPHGLAPIVIPIAIVNSCLKTAIKNYIGKKVLAASDLSWICSEIGQECNLAAGGQAARSFELSRCPRSVDQSIFDRDDAIKCIVGAVAGEAGKGVGVPGIDKLAGAALDEFLASAKIERHCEVDWECEGRCSLPFMVTEVVEITADAGNEKESTDTVREELGKGNCAAKLQGMNAVRSCCLCSR